LVKKIKIRYIGVIPIWIPKQGIIKEGESFMGVKRDLERKDMINFEKKNKGVKK